MSNNKTIKIIGLVLTLIVPTYVLYLWFTIQSQYFSFGNNSWLMVAAERLLAGQSLVDHIYETNPPLSIIIYIPHIIFSWAMNTAPPIAGFYATTTEIAFALLLSTLIIKRFDFLSFNQKTLFLISFLIAITTAAGIFITEREHLIFIWLVPFIICQFAITEKIRLPAYLYIPTLLIGSIMLLVKPHYGLIPATIFLIRMFHHKKIFSIIKDTDFIILSTVTALYTTSLFTISDYGIHILPHVIQFYPTHSPLSQMLAGVIKYISLCVPLLILEIALSDIKDRSKRFLNLFHICLFLSFIPYFVQMKGFPNHIIPIYGFFIISLSASLILRIHRLPPKLECVSPALCMGCILLFVLNNTPLSTKTMRHKDVEKLEALQYINKHCPSPCTYFAFHADMEIFNSIGAYTGMVNATRYNSYWWLVTLYYKDHDQNEEIRKNIQPVKKKFSISVEEDFKHYKPKLLLIAKELPIGNNYYVDFIDFFSEYSDLNKLIETNYIKIDEASFEFKEYYKGTDFSGIEGGYNYDVYERKNSNNNN